MKNFKQQGGTLIYSNTTGSTIAAGSPVVVGSQIGVAVNDIPDGADGALSMEGVFGMPKLSGTAIAQGDAVMWDESAGAFTASTATPAAGDVSGACTAWAAADASATSVDVKINTGVGTVT